MKKALLFLLALLLFGGGGFCGYALLVKKQSPMELANTLMGKDTKKKKSSAAKKKKENIQQLKYVEMPPIVVSIVRDGRVVRMYSAQIMVEVVGSASEAAVKAQMPVLKDGFFQVLYGLGALPQHVDVSRGSIAKTHLQKVADEVMGKGIVRAVLIQSTFDRPV
jgi:flagellar basal body-associated protein FliL